MPTAATIYVSEATSFNGFNKSPGLHGKDPSIEAKANPAKSIDKKLLMQLKKEHITDYHSLFNRVQIRLG